MKTGLILSATASLMLLGSTAVFAQSYGAPGAVTLKPGQIQSLDTTVQAPGNTVRSNVGIVSLKPGETISTASQQDFGSTQSGATDAANGPSFLKPGQAG